MRVNNETEISKLGFQIANKLDRNRSELVEVIAMGPATVKVVKVVELLKRVLAEIHISVDMVNARFEETYQPLYEGLQQVKIETSLPALKATFSFDSKKLVNLTGYQKIQNKVDPVETGKYLQKASQYVIDRRTEVKKFREEKKEPNKEEKSEVKTERNIRPKIVYSQKKQQPKQSQ